MILSLVILNDQFLVRSILACLQKKLQDAASTSDIGCCFIRGIAMILTEMRLQSQYAKARRRALAYQNQLEEQARRAEYERRQAAQASKPRQLNCTSKPRSSGSSSYSVSGGVRSNHIDCTGRKKFK